jgi:Protein of unknown function (DUF1573)
MKKVALSLFSLILLGGVFAQQPATATATTATVQKAKPELIKFTEAKYDFGKIKQGVPVTHIFAFKNISNQVVVIESATASCGCTTPIKPEQPIAKGKEDKITAGFNAAAPGPFEKTIYVKVAGDEKPLELKIKGEVLTNEDFAKYEASKPKKAGK